MARLFYTDGSVLNNGRDNAVGGFAFVEVSSDESQMIKYFSSPSEEVGKTVTNIRMEMRAVIGALHECDPNDAVIIKSDSAYIVNGMIEKWYEKWAEKGRTSTGAVPKNIDLWAILVRASRRPRVVVFQHVKGHKDNRWNIQADKLAGQAMREKQAEYLASLSDQTNL